MENTTAHLLTQLNEQQRQAVLATKGPLLVIAGAGSGKTRVITTRIAHLLATGTQPSRIVALTFTNKAAREMFERLEHSLEGYTQRPFIGTFHSFCLQLLKRYHNFLDIPQFSILDGDDQEQLINTVIKRAHIQERITAKTIAFQISKYKNSTALGGIPTDDALIDRQFLEIYRLYEKEKKSSNCFDFDDLLLKAYELFSKYPAVRDQFQKEIDHVLVDEYQDTNHVQAALLQAMILKDDATLAIDSVCAVGDEDQSIYSWRGATVDNIIVFPRTYTGTTMIKIEQNYRSVQPILDVANHVIQKNIYRNPKKLWSDKKASDRVRVLQFTSGYQEAETICALLKIGKTVTPLKKTAILYRAHYQSRTVEETLLKLSIPYKIIGGIQFYERKEIKDLIAHLKLLTNPFDRVSFKRIMNCPPRGLGEKFEEQWFQLWDEQPLLNCVELIDHMIKEKLVPSLKQTALHEIRTVLTRHNGTERPTTALSHVIQSTGYYSYLKKAFPKEEAETKIDNVKELLRAAEHFEQNNVTTVTALLEEIALMQEHYKKDEETSDYVQLMTMHAAKGLEFDTVVISGLEEMVFPSSRSLDDPAKLEEERRLFYVGITRARERLVMTHAKYRYSFGSMTEQIPSRFVRELPNKGVVHEDCSYWNQSQTQSYIQDWLKIAPASTSSIMTFGATRVKMPEPKITPVRKTIKKAPTTSAPKKKIERPLAQKPAGSLPVFSSKWRAHSTVTHQEFGIGIIQTVHDASDNPTLTIRFKNGVKKIKSNFVKAQ